MLGIQEPA